MKRLRHHQISAKRNFGNFGYWKCTAKLPNKCEFLSVHGINENINHNNDKINFVISSLENSEAGSYGTYEFLVIKELHEVNIDDDYVFLGCASNLFLNSANISSIYSYNIFYKKLS